MTGFLLDTNVLSEFSRIGQPDHHVDRWLKTTAEGSLFASVLTFAEIRRGIELLPLGKRRSQLEQWQDEMHRLKHACSRSPKPLPTDGPFFRRKRNGEELP